jgi:hypothetical protein
MSMTLGKANIEEDYPAIFMTLGGQREILKASPDLQIEIGPWAGITTEPVQNPGVDQDTKPARITVLETIHPAGIVVMNRIGHLPVQETLMEGVIILTVKIDTVVKVGIGSRM